MLQHSFFIFVFVSSNFFINAEHLQGPLRSPTKQSFVLYGARNSILSPDKPEDDATFAVVDFQYHDYSTKTVIDINWRLENWKNQRINDCHSSLVNWPSNITDPTLTRLKDPNNNKVVLAWTEFSRPGVLVMDFLTCYVTFLGPQHTFHPSVVTAAEDGGLYLFVRDSQFCKNVDWGCVVKYDSDLRMVGEPKPFFVFLYWDAMRVDPLINGDYLARGLGEFTYDAVVVDGTTGKPKNKTRLDYGDRSLQVVHSGLSSCWIRNAFYGPTVNCTHFNRWGELIFTRNVTIDDERKGLNLLAMRELDNGELFILTGTKFWKYEDAWMLKWAKLSRSSGVVGSGTARFNCTSYHQKDLVVYDVWQEDERTYCGYACENGDRYIYDVVSL